MHEFQHETVYYYVNIDIMQHVYHTFEATLRMTTSTFVFTVFTVLMFKTREFERSNHAGDNRVCLVLPVYIALLCGFSTA